MIVEKRPGATGSTDGVFILREIGQRVPPIRFAVEVGAVQYRVFSYFPVGRDLSIAVHSYFRGNHTWAKRIDKPVEDLSPQERRLSISEALKTAVPFVPEKHTFHQSGVLNMKDTKGARLMGQDDVESIPFDSIEENVRLCYFYPTLYDRYPKVRESDGKHHNVFRLVGMTERTPSMIEIRLSRKGSDLVARLREAYPGFAAFVDPWTLEERGLDIYTVFRKPPNAHFPSTHAFAKEFH